MAKSSLGKKIGVLIVTFPLLFFGASSFDFGAESYTAVKVGDYSLDRETYERVLQNQLESLADVYGSAAVQSDEFRQRVGQDIKVTYARRFLMLEYMNDIGLKVVENEIEDSIRNDETFAVDGSFSAERFTDIIDNPNLYLREVEENLLIDKFTNNLIDSDLQNEDFLLALKDYRSERRFIRHKKISVDIEPDIEFEESELINYYNENLESYIEPAKIKFDYILIDPSKFESQITINDEDLLLAYEERDAYNKENEERQLGLILVEEEEQANELLGQINQGGDFAALAQEFSIDSSSSEAGGDLGFLVREDLDEEVAQAVFAAEVKEVVGPFDLGGQWGLFKVNGLLGKTQESFEEVKEDLIKTTRQQEIDLILDEIITTYDDMQAAGESIEAIADLLEVEVFESDWINSRISFDDLTFPFEDRNVAIEINQGEFLARQDVSNIVEREDGVYVGLFAKDQEPEELNDFEDVQEEIIATIKKQRAFVNAFSVLGDELDQLKEGKEVVGLNFDDYPLVELEIDSEETPEDINARDITSIFSYADSVAEEELPYYIASIDLEENVINVFKIEDIQLGEQSEDDLETLNEIQNNFIAEMIRLGVSGDLENKYGVTFYNFEYVNNQES